MEVARHRKVNSRPKPEDQQGQARSGRQAERWFYCWALAHSAEDKVSRQPGFAISPARWIKGKALAGTRGGDRGDPQQRPAQITRQGIALLVMILGATFGTWGVKVRACALPGVEQIGQNAAIVGKIGRLPCACAIAMI